MQLPNLSLGRRSVEFTHVTGEVLDEKKWSDTHVSGGGGSADSQGRTHVSPVTSTKITNQEIWIKEHGAGAQTPVRLVGFDVPISAGQWVTFVSASRGYIELNNVLYVNHDAGSSWERYVHPRYLEKELRPFVYLGRSLLFWLIVLAGVIGGIAGSGLGYLVLAGSIASLVALTVPWVRVQRALLEHMKKLREVVLQEGGRSTTTG